jgi:hypothetical protein
LLVEPYLTGDILVVSQDMMVESFDSYWHLLKRWMGVETISCGIGMTKKAAKKMQMTVKKTR